MEAARTGWMRLVASDAPGSVVLIRAATRVAAVPLIAIRCVAIASTKLAILLEQGFWKMAHESRTDIARLLGSVFRLSVGAGPWSIDARWARSRRRG